MISDASAETRRFIRLSNTRKVPPGVVNALPSPCIHQTFASLMHAFPLRGEAREELGIFIFCFVRGVSLLVPLNLAETQRGSSATRIQSQPPLPPEIYVRP